VNWEEEEEEWREENGNGRSERHSHWDECRERKRDEEWREEV